METSVKDYLKYHVSNNPLSKVIKVTVTRYYEIPEGTSTDPKELLDEWFNECPINRHHAFREGQLLLHHFNGDAQIVDVDSL